MIVLKDAQMIVLKDALPYPNFIYSFLQDISMAGSSIPCIILEGWKILGIVVGVYIIVMSADIAYKHANCLRKSSQTVDVSFIYHEFSGLRIIRHQYFGWHDAECNCHGDN
jgi:hypothetical protein